MSNKVAYSFYINPDNMEIVGLDDFKGKKLNVHRRHRIDNEFLNYHKMKFFEKN